jgi:hypothetical protein
VTESHKGEKTLIGSALRSGYNSHFVITNKDGTVYEKVNDREPRDERTLYNGTWQFDVLGGFFKISF